MANGDLVRERISHSVIGAFYKVYNTLGYGFLELLYVRALEYELKRRGHSVFREFPVQVRYEGLDIGTFRLDMVVEDRVIVEVKATHSIDKSVDRQVYNYLKASSLPMALLLHFGPKPGIRRLILRQREE